MKLSVFSLIKAIFLIATVTFLLSNSGNPPNQHTGAPGESTCGACHSGGNYAGNVSISGVPATLTPNTTYTVTLTNNVTSSSLPVRGGFQIVVLDENNNNIGDLDDISSDVRTTTVSNGREYAEQDGAKSYNGGNTVSWTFEWTSPSSAPQNGDITFYYVMNMANGGGTSGDNAIISNTTVNLAGGGNPLSVSVSKLNDVSCFGGDDGAAVATASDGSGTYFYQWDNGSTSSVVNDLSAGNNFVTVTDSNGETATGSVFISQPSALSATVNTIDVTCNGGDDGIGVVSPFGGVAPYQILWSDGNNNASNTDLEAGVYTVTITDNNSCQITETVIISEPPALVANIITDSSISCFGGSDGALSVSVSGGSPSYSFQWSTGDNSNTINGLDAGVYSVTVFDANLCQTTATIVLSQPSVLSGSINIDSSISCFGGSDGALSVSASGGNPSYSYLWSTDAESNSITGLSEGVYTVSITDSNGCETIESITLSEPNQLTLTLSSTDESASNANDGTASVSVTGGSAPYDYLWSTGAETNSIDGLSPGVYTVTVTDNNGCIEEGTVTIQAFPCALSASASSTEPSCFGESDGSIVIASTGAVGTLSYSWSHDPSLNSATADGLPSSEYTVIVTDDASCSEELVIALGQPSEMQLSFLTSNLSCFDVCDGSAEVSVVGGVEPYSYSWSNSETTALITDLCPGLYVLTVTDGNACEKVSEINILNADILSISAVITDVSCFGGSDGAIDVSVNGGTGNYTYQWSTNSNGEDLIGVGIGTYTITVTDDNGCQVIESFDVLEPQVIDVQSLVTDESGNNANDGSISLTVTGGTAPYSYEWSNEETSSSINGLSPGTYTVTITDSNLCSSTLTENILAFNCALEIQATKEIPSCFEGSDGSIGVEIQNGTPPYSYQWSTGDTLSELNGLEAGTYSLTLTDFSDCTVSIDVVLEEPSALIATGIVSNPVCANLCDGFIELEITGGTTPYNVNWSTGNNELLVSDLCEGTYSVTVTDDNACVFIDEFQLVDPAAIVVDILFEDPGCDGSLDDDMWVNVLNNQGEYSVNWLPVNISGDTIKIEDLDYSVIVTDEFGCIGEQSIDLDFIEILSLNSELTPVSSFGANDAEISLSIEGGVEPYTIEWDTGEQSQSLSDLAPGVYTVEVVDGNDCSAQLSIEVEEFDCNLIVEANIVNPTCVSDTSGIISLSLENFLEPVTYNWSNNSSDSEISSLVIGSYTVDILDANACSFSGSYTIEATDISPPELLSSSIDAVLDANGEYELSDTALDEILFDDCEIATIEVSTSIFDCDDIGDNLIDLTVCDVNGNCFTGTLLLDLKDLDAPVISCPEDDFIPYCQEEYFYEIDLTDNCDNGLSLELISGLESGSEFPFGETTVFYKATDSSGNSSECVFNILKEGEEGLSAIFESTDLVLMSGDTLVLESVFLDVFANSILSDINFNWYSDGVLVSEINTASDILLEDYDFLELELSYGEICFDSYYFVVNLPSSTQMKSEDKFEVYPNPSSDILYLNGFEQEFIGIDLYDSRGIKTNVVFESDELGVYQIDVSGLDSNVYFLKIHLKDETIVKRIIIL